MAFLIQWTSLSKLWDILKDREAWHAAVMGWQESNMTEKLTTTNISMIISLEPHTFVVLSCP